ncbi:hypothetical protein MEQ_01152 [Candida albicans P87]|nr:hypothetical protein MEO_01164 [Candida albicans P94015]KGR02921.1 hypothetical protein MG1_01167 [Candida albicans GC75]KGU13432.1 hypothetical protein MEQ_01152 [Candida albicans P87]KGU34554.1 putative cell wall adhesin-like protein [Candida albicans P75063]KHC48322.1 putative cell wall adhesin-like protein [Candida albicans Ca6]KHC74487.1 putative cell wall adhesin-like protein [Candida albicans P75016]RLP62461.1 hypothetical protein L150_01159 [Candida albicans Ca529L]
MLSSKIYSLVLLSLFGLARSADDVTTTITTTPYVTATTTVGLQEDIYATEYIYTDDNGKLTTTTVLASTVTNPAVLQETTPTTKPSADPSSSDDNSNKPSSPTTATSDNSESSPTGFFTEIKVEVPEGVYSTSTKYTHTVLDDGQTAALELVVLYTAFCEV